MADVEHLTVKDAENAASAILALVLKYPEFPKLVTGTYGAR